MRTSKVSTRFALHRAALKAAAEFKDTSDAIVMRSFNGWGGLTRFSTQEDAVRGQGEWVLQQAIKIIVEDAEQENTTVLATVPAVTVAMSSIQSEIVEMLGATTKDDVAVSNRIDAADFMGRSVLHMAGRAGLADLLRNLIRKGGNPRAEDQWVSALQNIPASCQPRK